MNQPKTAEEQKNAAVVRELYASAEASAKDTPKFVSMFAEGGYFYDVAAGKKYYGKDIGLGRGRLRHCLPEHASRTLQLLLRRRRRCCGAISERYTKGKPGNSRRHDSADEQGDARSML